MGLKDKRKSIIRQEKVNQCEVIITRTVTGGDQTAFIRQLYQAVMKPTEKVSMQT